MKNVRSFRLIAGGLAIWEYSVFAFDLQITQRAACVPVKIAPAEDLTHFSRELNSFGKHRTAANAAEKKITRRPQ